MTVGADAFIAKPAQPRQLQGALETARARHAALGAAGAAVCPPQRNTIARGFYFMKRERTKS